MISEFWTRLRRGVSEATREVVAPKPDTNNIYVQLQIALAMIEEKPIVLKATTSSLGRISIHTETLGDFNKALIEVLEKLQSKEHVDSNSFFLKNIKTVRFDEFLFVENGYYSNNSQEKLAISLDLIKDYIGHMKDADKAHYGCMEHNHRQLYDYTKTLTEFLNLLITNFGD